MRESFNRRDVLTWGLGTAACWVGRGLPRLPAAEPGPAEPYLPPDQSARAPSLPVALQRCQSYEPGLLRRTLDRGLDLIGGIQKLVGGKTVTVKINVTGGPGTACGLPGYRTYHVHPNLVAAVCGALADAGARQIVLVESQYSTKRPEDVLTGGGWDVAAICAAGGQRVQFEDTRNQGRWPAYARLSVPWGGFVFPAYDLNARYEKTDVFVSLAKLKDHTAAGVTMCAKNLFGISPISLYGSDAPNEDSLSNRADILHNGKRRVPAGVPAELAHRLPADWRYRVPRVTADLVGVRPVDLAIIDGIETIRGGEGPWVEHLQPLRPQVLLAGRNVVTTDAIATAVMGYDPRTPHRQFPFPGDNHLLLLERMGVGTADPKRIECLGLPLAQAVFPFNPKRITLDLPTAWCYPSAAAGLRA